MNRHRTTILLVAPMLSPFLAELLGWHAWTPFGMSPAAHAAALATVALATLGVVWSRKQRPSRRQLLEWAAAPLLGVAVAYLLMQRSNSFYTASTLMDGMALLFIAHLVTRIFRGSAAGNRRPIPPVTLADDIGTAVAWLVLSAWVLIWQEHRHFAAGLLLIAGAFQLAALVILVPDALAGSGWLARRRKRRR